MRVVRLSPDGRELAGLLPAAAGRVLLGITGAPGAGKSTLAAHVAAACGGVVVPMDGFHLADVELARRGLLDRKGAPETFDGWGYAALLARLRSRPSHVVMAPGFSRDLEQPLAGAIPVPPTAGLVVTEGNYLLLDDPEWCAVRAQLDAVWHVFAADSVRVPGSWPGTSRSASPPPTPAPGWTGSTSPTPPSSRPPGSGRTSYLT